ncbi:MAG: hypothetical protein QOH74_658 [Gaiellales bacterium]|nr:hypothetical protein [Gaiellales bacterium]
MPGIESGTPSGRSASMLVAATTSTGAHEQRNSESVLELADCLRQRRLGDVQTLSRTGGVQLLGHGMK